VVIYLDLAVVHQVCFETLSSNDMINRFNI